MEKEQKKLLLVAVSVGVFLLVTITAAIVIMTPKASIEEATFSSSRPLPQTERIPATETIIIQPQPAIVAQPQETNVNIDYDEENISIGVEGNDSGNLSINIPRPTTAAVPNTPEIIPPTGVSRPVATVTPRQQTAAPAPVAQPVPVPTTVQPTASRQAPPAAAPARPAAPTRTNISDYWVQTGAFTAQVRAEDARDLLASKGITSIIENRQIDGRTWYRVRLGPYTSEREANYWLALVRTIDGFGESQVRQTVRQQ